MKKAILSLIHAKEIVYLQFVNIVLIEKGDVKTCNYNWK